MMACSWAFLTAQATGMHGTVRRGEARVLLVVLLRHDRAHLLREDLDAEGKEQHAERVGQAGARVARDEHAAVGAVGHAPLV